MVAKGVRLAIAVKVVGTGVGFTVMVNIMGVPLQLVPFNGVTVIVAVMALAVLFKAANEAISPVPLVASPMPGVSLTQLNVIAVPLKLIGEVAAPLVRVWLFTAFTLGIAFIV